MKRNMVYDGKQRDSKTFEIQIEMRKVIKGSKNAKEIF